jgi:riboflavin kinase / FMN adenylyltransferase
VPDANAKLARAFSYTGRVVQGQQLARTLGFPTANLLWLDAPAALYGVYAVRVYSEHFECLPAVASRVLTCQAGVASLGIRPVVQGSACWLEVHLFDFDGDLYGQRLRVDFIKKLRPEQNFDGLDALVAQVNIDITQAKAALDEL